MSSIIYSPGRFSDHASDERFANERSGPRISDFSVSSGYERFKSDSQSPKFHKDVEFSSPSYQRSGSNSSEDVWSQTKNASLETYAGATRNSDGIHRVQVFHPLSCLYIYNYLSLLEIVFNFSLTVILY